MPTSVTGTSSSPRRGRAAASRVSGFTLLEILVVVVIIGIITTMAVVSTRVLGGDHEMDQETKRFVAVLSQAREDAMLRARSLPEGLEAGLWLESRPVKLVARVAPTERTPPQPQVVLMASGDVVPFELRLERAGTSELRAVVGSTEGKFEVLSNDAVARR